MTAAVGGGAGVTEGDRASGSGEGELAPGVLDDERVGRLLDGTERPRDARRVLRFVLRHPDGAPIGTIVERTIGRTDSRRNERFVRRLAERNPRLLEIDRRQAVDAVRPSEQALHLITGRQISKPPDGSPAKDYEVHRLLRSQSMLNEEGRQTVLDRFSGYVDRTEDMRIVLRNEDARGEEYAVMPYKTRFTDDGRIGQMWRRYQGAFENATDRYQSGVLATLTTDPKMHDSIRDAWENISESFNRLMAWLSSDSRLGFRPDYIGVLESTDSGLPHLHVMIFGPSWLVDQDELSQYWGKYQGRVVDIRGMRNRNGEWIEKGGPSASIETAEPGEPVPDGGAPDGGEGDDLNGKAYLGKYLSKLMDGVGKDAGDLAGADAEEEESWKLGMYWATDRQIVRTSHDLKPADEPEPVEVVPGRWSFVGAWNEREIPARVLRRRYERRRAPPERDDPPPD